jgi:soluble lytic murein transglycosylase-like protein
MRRTDGLVKILDFGIAKLLEPETPERSNETTGIRTHTETGLVMGTVNYMSPEQARGLPVDERTDIWSLGVVLYEMLAGRLPFSGATRMDTLVAVLDREAAPLSGVANERYVCAPLLQSIVERCLSKEITERYRTAGEMVGELKQAREQLRNPPPHVKPATKNRPLNWSIVALVVLLLIASAAAFLYDRSVVPPVAEATPAPAKLYWQMSEREQLDFVAAQEQRISTMMSDRPVKLNDDAVRAIKTHVDWYAGRLSQPPDSEAISAVYERARQYVPVIARSFAARKVPVIIGIYLPVIESGYRECYESSLGATGLFQFLPATAQNYGVARDEMCDVEKMAPAAAHYIADRMAELGEDSESVTLVLISYNRGAEWVRDALRQLRTTQNYERNFWTLLANRETLDEAFRRETAGYVPSFYAAAIIGENPQNFGLRTPPLSTLAGQTALLKK